MERLSAALQPFFLEGNACGNRVDALLRLVVAALLRHDALRRLLAVQQLDTQDVEGAYQAKPPLALTAPNAPLLAHLHVRRRMKRCLRTVPASLPRTITAQLALRRCPEGARSQCCGTF